MKVKSRIHILVSSLILAGFIDCCQGQARVDSGTFDAMLQLLLSHDVSEIDVNELKNNQYEVVLLDARSSWEYEVSHLKNARFAGYQEFETEQVKDIPKDMKIVVYCSVGYRNEKVAKKMMESGYPNVYNLYGGIFEWKNQGILFIMIIKKLPGFMPTVRNGVFGWNKGKGFRLTCFNNFP